MNCPLNSGELADSAIMVGPSACANRTRSAQPARGPASMLIWTEAVEVIMAAPAAAVPVAVKKLSIA